MRRSAAMNDEYIEQLMALDAPKMCAEIRSRFLAISDRRKAVKYVYDAKRALWDKSNDFHSSMAGHLVCDVHPIFRGGFHVLLNTAGVVDVPRFRQINSTLHHHHRLEDSWWFPKLRGLSTELRTEIDILEADHSTLVELEDVIVKGHYLVLNL